MKIKVAEWRKLSKSERFILIVDEAIRQRNKREGLNYSLPRRRFEILGAAEKGKKING